MLQYRTPRRTYSQASVPSLARGLQDVAQLSVAARIHDRIRVRAALANHGRTSQSDEEGHRAEEEQEQVHREARLGEETVLAPPRPAPPSPAPPRPGVGPARTRACAARCRLRRKDWVHMRCRRLVDGSSPPPPPFRRIIPCLPHPRSLSLCLSVSLSLTHTTHARERKRARHTRRPHEGAE